MSLNLIRWGVCPDVAASTTAAWLKAYNLREIQTWTNHPDATTIPPEEIVKNALGNCVPDHKISYELLEEAVFACLWSNIRKLADVVSMLSPMKANFESDPLAFWERLGKYSSKKIAGPSWVEKQPEWTFFVFEYWIGRGLPEDIPPVCLWTDATIQQLSGAPNDLIASPGEGRSSTLRQFLRREPRCLIRPKGKAYCLRNGTWVEVTRR